MKMTFGGAVANWKNEQLQIEKWFKTTNEEKICKEMHSLLIKVYLKCIQKYTSGLESSDIRNADIACGTGGIEEISMLKNKERKIHYIFAKGRFMDPERRSYFNTEEVIVEGNVELKDL